MIKLSSHVNHFLFYILIQSIVAFSATPSPPQQLILKSGKIKHVADTGIAEPITIWCSVSHPATINSAYFVKTSTKKGNNKLVGVVELQNASYTFEKPTISDAGQWKCVLKTSTVEQTAIIDIYSRPVIETNDEIRLEEKDKVKEPFTLIAHGKNAKSNGEAKLLCTAHGYPKPAVKWTRRVDQIPLKHPEYVTIGNSITLKNLDNEKAGIYVCTALNKFRIDGKEMVFRTTMERQVRVKWEHGWIIPLMIICIILICLVAVVLFFEWKKSKEKFEPAGPESDD